MAYDYGALFLMGLDANKHKFFKGNHDNYCEEHTTEAGFNLGDFGLVEHGDAKFFFVRGAHSIDQSCRTPWIDWFPDEQLTWKQGQKCIQEYIQAEPDVVITHECPQSVERRLFPDRGILRHFKYSEEWSSATAVLLEQCFRAHAPQLWFFGHFHQERVAHIDGTEFRCLPELGYLDI
jgi:hypothetical protein